MVSGSLSYTASQYVTIPYSPVLDNFTAFSISCWIYVTGAGGSFINKGWAGNGSILMYTNGSTGYSFDITSNTAVGYGTGVVTSNNAWHHLVFTYDGANIEAYCDGVTQSGPVAAAAGTLTLNSAITIGVAGTNIADVRFYNVALTPTEVSSLFAGHNVARGLVTEFPFPEGSGTTTTDIVGGLVGTLTNGPTWSTNIPNAFKATHFTYRYVYSPQAYQSSNTNAISDTFKINNDQGWAGGPNDDQYYTLGMFIGPTVGSLVGAIPVNLNLTLSYTSGTPTINFTASYNGVIQNTFGLPVLVGDIYTRQIIFTPGIGSDSGIAGDSVTQNPTITYYILDNSIVDLHYLRSYSFVYTPTTLPNTSRFIQSFNGFEHWTFSTFPFNLEYNISVTDFAFSLDGGATYYPIQGSDLSIKTDGKYLKSAYPTQNYNMIVPGQLPTIGGK
jgi:hypothetical protein